MTKNHENTTHHQEPCGCATEEQVDQMRRRLLASTGAVAAVAAASIGSSAEAASDKPAYADPDSKGLPEVDMEIEPGRTALVVVDPQIDFLSDKGVSWGVVGESVTEHNVVDNIESLFKAAKDVGMQVFISPHYYYPHDHKWAFEGVLEKTMHSISMFDRKDPLSLDDFEGSGADWMPQYKKYINDGETVVVSPHKVYSLAQNDLNLQMRKRGIDKVIIAGMSSNLCVQAHLYEMLELGYEVAVVRDATAGAIVPEGDGYLAALINFRMVANGVWWTDDAVNRIRKAYT